MRLHVTGYYQGEYFYMLGNDGLIINYKEYTVQKTKKIYKIKRIKSTNIPTVFSKIICSFLNKYIFGICIANYVL